MDEGTIKFLVYTLGIMAAVIGILASVYKIREARLKIHAHKLERKGSDTAVPLQQPTNISAASRAVLKIQKKFAKQRAKELKKSAPPS
jgi:hypothetical protein